MTEPPRPSPYGPATPPPVAPSPAAPGRAPSGAHDDAPTTPLRRPRGAERRDLPHDDAPTTPLRRLRRGEAPDRPSPAPARPAAVPTPERGPDPATARRSPRGPGGPVTPARAIGVTVAAGAAAAAGGWWYGRGDGGTELPTTLDGRARATAQDDTLDGATAATGAGSGAGTTALPALQVPSGLTVEHLLSRVTHGPTDALRAEVTRDGPAAWLTRQFAPAKLADPGGDAVRALFPDLALSSADAARTGKDPAVLQRQLAAAHLGRAVWSSRQLLEIMVDLWSNHFSVPCPSDRAGLHRHRFDADLLRAGALGSFEQLLQACAVHPATLTHLGTGESVGDQPNEHYARELLEVHTVGPGAGFTERDVQQAALLLTGFQVRDGVPRFVPGHHHVGQVTIMQFVHPNDTPEGGRAAVRLFLTYLARHPATATMLARKLAVRFVADDPPADLVRRLAQVHARQRTGITPMLVALLTSPEFAASAGAKLRRPAEHLAATVRTLGTPPPRAAKVLLDLTDALDAAGHRPLASTRPGGYPDVASAWQSPATALAGFNTTARLVRDVTGTLVTPPPATRVAAVEAVGRRVLGRPPTAAERAAAEALLAATDLPVTPARGSWQQRETVGLIATLLLSSPAALAR